ncbi:HNH endonuclease family protein [Lutibacter sp.]
MSIKFTPKLKNEIFALILSQEDPFAEQAKEDGILTFLFNIWDLRSLPSTDDIFSKLIPLILKDNLLINIKEHLTNTDNIPLDDEFIESLPKHQFKGKLIDRAKYVLESIEYFHRGNTNELTISSSEEVHLEHIIPQTIKTKKAKLEFGDWVKYLGNNSLVKHKKFVNYIGNMTLLGETLNIQASNNPFTKKKKSYRKSSFLITQDLAKQNDFKFYHVNKRSEELTTLAVKIWKV